MPPVRGPSALEISSSFQSDYHLRGRTRNHGAQQRVVGVEKGTIVDSDLSISGSVNEVMKGEQEG